MYSTNTYFPNRCNERMTMAQTFPEYEILLSIPEITETTVTSIIG